MEEQDNKTIQDSSDNIGKLYQDAKSRGIKASEDEFRSYIEGGEENRKNLFNDLKSRGMQADETTFMDYIGYGATQQEPQQQKPSYEEWYKTVPEDRNDTSSYDLKKAYETTPYDQMEKWRTASSEQLKEDEFHLPSVSYDEDKDEYTFLKSGKHKSVGKEIDWYNSDDPDAVEFRNKYKLDQSGEYYRYVPRMDFMGIDLSGLSAAQKKMIAPLVERQEQMMSTPEGRERAAMVMRTMASSLGSRDPKRQQLLDNADALDHSDDALATASQMATAQRVLKKNEKDKELEQVSDESFDYGEKYYATKKDAQKILDRQYKAIDGKLIAAGGKTEGFGKGSEIVGTAMEMFDQTDEGKVANAKILESIELDRGDFILDILESGDKDMQEVARFYQRYNAIGKEKEELDALSQDLEERRGLLDMSDASAVAAYNNELAAGRKRYEAYNKEMETLNRLKESGALDKFDDAFNAYITENEESATKHLLDEKNAMVDSMFGDWIDRKSLPIKKQVAKEYTEELWSRIYNAGRNAQEGIPMHSAWAQSQYDITPESSALQIARQYAQKSDALISNDNKTIYANSLAKGAVDAVADMDFWTFGINEAVRGFISKDIMDKVGEDMSGYDSLTEDEKLAFDAMQNYWLVQNLFKPGGWYAAGKTTAESLPFIAAMWGSGGIVNAIKGGAKGAERVALRNIAGQAEKITWKGALKAAGNMALEGAVYATTTGLPHTVAGTLEYLMPQSESHYDLDNGGIKVDKISGSDESVMSAIGKAWYDQFVEGMSEAFSTYGLEPLQARAYAKIAGRIGERLGTGGNTAYRNIVRAAFKEGSTANKMFRNISDFPNEFAEEMFGGFMRCIGGTSTWDQEFNGETIAQTAYGLLPMQVIFGAMGGANMRKHNQRMRESQDFLGQFSPESKPLYDKLSGMSTYEGQDLLDREILSVQQEVDALKAAGKFDDAMQKKMAARMNAALVMKEQLYMDEAAATIKDANKRNAFEAATSNINEQNGNLVYAEYKDGDTNKRGWIISQDGDKAVISDGKKRFKVDASDVTVLSEYSMEDVEDHIIRDGGSFAIEAAEDIADPVAGQDYHDGSDNAPLALEGGGVLHVDEVDEDGNVTFTMDGKQATVSRRQFRDIVQQSRNNIDYAKADIDAFSKIGDGFDKMVAHTDDPATAAERGRNSRDARANLAEVVGEERVKEFEEMDSNDLAMAYAQADATTKQLMGAWMTMGGLNGNSAFGEEIESRINQASEQQYKVIGDFAMRQDEEKSELFQTQGTVIEATLEDGTVVVVGRQDDNEAVVMDMAGNMQFVHPSKLSDMHRSSAMALARQSTQGVANQLQALQTAFNGTAFQADTEHTIAIDDDGKEDKAVIVGFGNNGSVFYATEYAPNNDGGYNIANRSVKEVSAEEFRNMVEGSERKKSRQQSQQESQEKAAEDQGDVKPGQQVTVMAGNNPVSGEYSYTAGMHFVVEPSGTVHKFKSMDELKESMSQAAAATASVQDQQRKAQIAEQSEMEKEYQRRFEEAKTPEEKAAVIQEFIDQIKTDETIALTVANQADVLRKNGMSEDALAKHIQYYQSVKARGDIMGGFYFKGIRYLLAEEIENIEHARSTYVHERQHGITKNNLSLLNQIAGAASKEELLGYVRTMSGSNAYDNASVETLAEEFISMAMEVAYRTADVESALRQLGVNNEALIQTIKQLDNEQRQSDSLAAARRGRGSNLHVRDDEQGNGRPDGRNQGREPGDVGEQGLRPVRGSGEETGGSQEVKSPAQLLDELIGREGDNAANKLANTISSIQGSIATAEANLAEARQRRDNLPEPYNEESQAAMDAANADITNLIDEIDNLNKQAATYMLMQREQEKRFADWIGMQERSEAEIAYSVAAVEDLEGMLIADNQEEARYSVRYVPQESQIEDIVDDLVASLGVSSEEARRWVASETSLAAIILDEHNSQFLDYAADDRYEAIKKDSDYPQGTVDFNNICRKRKHFTDIYQRLQRQFPNRIITGRDLATIRQIMKNHGMEVACGLCYVEDRRQLLGEIAQSFIDELKGGFRNYAKGSATKKANAKKFKALLGNDKKEDLSIYDLITLDGSQRLCNEHRGIYDAFKAFNAARGQQAGNLFQGYSEYKREILGWSDKKVKSVNDNGGLRVFSYSDFEAHHLIDLVQIIQDCARRGVKIQGYTKVPAFARAVANTGVKLNRSLIPLGDTGIVDGKLAYDPVEGIDINDPNFLESNDNIGNILIGINDEQIRLAMQDPFIHFIIPYHSNQSNELRSLKNTGTWTNYKNEQTEKGENVGKHGVNIYTDVLNAAEAEGNPIQNERQFVERFLAVCKEKGWTPRFARFLNQDENGEYVYTPGYYKFLVDFKMFDEQGNILPQQPVRPIFDDEFNAQILNDYVEGAGVNMTEQENEVYDEIVKTIVDNETMYSVTQGFGSAGTSLNQIPAGMRKIDWESGTTNVDIGGGRFDKSTEYLAEQGVENLVFDPFNRSAEHNQAVAERVRDERVDTATVNNVLNVIDSEESRANVILQAAKAIKPDGTAYFTIYEGDKSGVGRQTKKDSWQNNRATKDYIQEIENYFDDVTLKNGVIVARKPKQTDEESIWDFDGTYSGNDIRYSVTDQPPFNVNGTVYQRDKKYGVGKSIGGRLYLHKDYADGVIPSELLEKAKAMLPNGFKYNALSWKKGQDEELRFDEAPDFDTAREPITGDYVTVNVKTGDVKQGHSDQIWHHKWQWVEPDYQGFDTQESYDWSRRWTEKIQHPSGWRGKWEEALEEASLPLDEGTRFRVTPQQDADYMDAVNRGDMETAQRMVMEAAKASMPNTKVVDENGNPLVMYHGTPNAYFFGNAYTGAKPFTVFNEKERGKNTMAQDAKIGFFFTPDERFASYFRTRREYDPITRITKESGYSTSNLYAVFLNMRNPLDLRNLSNEDSEIVHSMLPKYAQQDFDVDDVKRMSRTKNGSKELQIYLARNIDAVKANGYDGVINYVEDDAKRKNVEYEAFSPFQIKSADPVTYDDQGNVIPLSERFNESNNDIRYSVTAEQDAAFRKAYEEGDTETAMQMVREAASQAMPNTKVVDENGNPKVVYHQTNGTIYRNRETGQIWDELDWREQEQWDDRDDWEDYWIEEDFYTFSRKNARTTNELDGFFFAPEYDEYHGYGDRTIAAFVNIENPASQNDYHIDATYNDAGRNERIRLQQEGYDGVIFTEDGQVAEYIAFEPNQIKSADPFTFDDNGELIPLSERFNQNNNDIRYSFIGRAGAQRLDMEERSMRRLANLSVARQMEEAGKDANAIKLATGWERGKDGKWRYEIMEEDGMAMFNAMQEQLDKSNGGEVEMRLGDIFGGELTTAYPKLKDTTIKVYPSDRLNDGAFGSYSEDNNTIELAGKRPFDRVYTTLYHEIQHAIQGIEGFAYGGNPAYIAQLISDMSNNEKIWGYKLDLDRVAKEHPEHADNEAELFNDILDGLTEQQAISQGWVPEEGLRKQAFKIYQGKLDGERYRKSYEKYYDKLREAGRTNFFEGTPYELYNRIAGEVEARNVQQRIFMTYEERLKQLAEETEDVSRKDQLIIMSGDPVLYSVRGNSLNTKETILQELLKMADENKEDVQLRADATRAATEIIADLMLDMRNRRKIGNRNRRKMENAAGDIAEAQERYDKEVADHVTNLANIMLRYGNLDDLSRGEVSRLLAATKNSIGGEVMEQAMKIVDTLLNHQLKQAKAVLDRQLKTKPFNASKSGTRQQATLGGYAPEMMLALNEGIDPKVSDDEFKDMVSEAVDKMSSNNKSERDKYAARYVGLMLAKQYRDTIADSESRESDLRRAAKKQLERIYDFNEDGNKKLKPEYKGKLDDEHKAVKESVMEFESKVNEEIRRLRMERSKAYSNMSLALSDSMYEGKVMAKNFVEESIRRINEIHHAINSDLKGIPTDEHRQPTRREQLKDNGFFNLVFAPQRSFVEMTRYLAPKSVDGRGYIFDYFVPRLNAAWDAEWKNISACNDKLDAKASEVFGEGVKRWSDLQAIERNMPTIEVEFLDGGEMKPHTLTQGNALYIYMVNKMSDGAMKLRAMGITQEKVDEIVEQIDPRLIELADWIQEEFLPETRDRYNKVHMRMFGVPMAMIEDYFPLVINPLSRNQEESVDDDPAELTATVTGAIKERKTNTAALDVTNVDALSLVIGHINEMEHWAAYAEVARDLGTMLSYNRFKKRLANMNSARFGVGKKKVMADGKERVTFPLYERYKDACKIAVGTFRMRKATADTEAQNFAKGVTAAKIAFRAWTALKQRTSGPAFWSDVNPLMIQKMKSRPRETWNWAIENLPGFDRRFHARFAGNEMLEDREGDWKFWHTKFVKWCSRWGMAPNAAVDAFTIAIGARAIYESKLNKYKKAGYDEDVANKMALDDAASYNETQQSNNPAYLSIMQAERTFLSSILGLFRNGPFGYGRRLFRSIGNMKKLGKRNREEMVEYLAKKGVRNGLTEEQAYAMAQKTVKKRVWKYLWDSAVFGYVVQFAWNIAPYLPYIIGGDDDDEKRKMAKYAALHSLAGPLEGMPGGNILSAVIGDIVTGGEWTQYSYHLAPVISDIEKIKKEFGTDTWAAINDILVLLTSTMVGWDLKSLSDVGFATWDAFNGDMDAAKEFAVWMMRVAQVPKSQVDQFFLDEVGLTAREASKTPVEELAKRYANYYFHRNAPVTSWFYDDEKRDKVEERYEKQFYRMLEERLDVMPSEKKEQVFDNTEDTNIKKEIASKAAKERDTEDYYGRKPSSSWSDDTKASRIAYQKERTYEDMLEDFAVKKAIDEAKESGDDELYENITYQYKGFTDLMGELDGGKDDKATMQDMRRIRKQIIEEYDIEVK